MLHLGITSKLSVDLWFQEGVSLLMIILWKGVFYFCLIGQFTVFECLEGVLPDHVHIL